MGTKTKQVNLTFKQFLTHNQGVVLKIANDVPIHFYVESKDGRLIIELRVDE